MQQNEIQSDTEYLDILNYIATGLSITGCIWMLRFCLSTKPKTVALKLVMAIALSEFLYAVSNLLESFHKEEINNQIYCQVEGSIREFSVTLSMYFVTSTAVLCYKSSQYGSAFNQNKFLKGSVVIGILLSLAFTLPPLFMEDIQYQQAEQLFCWIVPTQGGQDKKFVVAIIFQAIPLILGLTITLLGYMKAIKNCENDFKSLIDNGTIDVKKLLWYPACLFIINVPAMIDDIIQIYHPSGNDFLKGVHLLLTHSSGFINALVYGLQMRNASNRAYERKPNQAYRVEMSDDSKTINSASQELYTANFPEYR